MAPQTVTFDPKDVFTLADLCREVGISSTAAYQWYDRNADRIPKPVARLEFKGGKAVTFWTGRDGKLVIEIYKERKAKYEDRIARNKART